MDRRGIDWQVMGYVLIIAGMLALNQFSSDLATGAIPVAAWLKPYIPSLVVFLLGITTQLPKVIRKPDGLPGAEAPPAQDGA